MDRVKEKRATAYQVLATLKEVVASFRSGLLNEDNARKALSMAEDRNRTVHTYNEAVADAIYGRLDGYAVLMETWLGAMHISLDDLKE